jgi:hypothetical protein
VLDSRQARGRLSSENQAFTAIVVDEGESMPKVNRGIGLLVIGLAVAALVVSQVGNTAAQAAGRDFSRCIQSCNETRKACGVACQDDCRALFPDDMTARDACIADCKVVCNDNSDECKQVCQNVKWPPSPEEP